MVRICHQMSDECFFFLSAFVFFRKDTGDCVFECFLDGRVEGGNTRKPPDEGFFQQANE